MRKIVVLSLLCIALAATQALAGTIVTENWESGGAAGWVNGGAGAPIVTDANTAKLAAGNHAVKTPDASSTGQGYKTLNLATATAKSWTATWNFYTAGATREFFVLYSYSGGGMSGNLQNVIALGHYNTTDYTKYNFRVALGTTGLATGGWGDTTISRTNNAWHAMKVEQIYNTGDTSATINFYVDGVLGRSCTTTAVYGVTAIRCGSAVSNGGAGAYYDDIVVSVPDPTVPEPGSLLAFGTGLIGLVGFAIRRRA